MSQMCAWIPFAIFLVVAPAHGTTVESFLRNREGVQKFKAKSYFPAYQSFLKALQEDPLSPEVQLNLGITFEVNEEWDKAIAAYRGALELLPERSSRRFEALFNLAGVYARQRKIPEALHFYQQALDLNPESIEVKNNIELLWQGGGGGGGKDQEPKDQKDKGDPKDQKPQDGKDQKEPQKPEQQEQKQKPRPFKSEELTPEDVKKIIDEIKNQEQSIRAQEYERSGKEAPRGKDW